MKRTPPTYSVYSSTMSAWLAWYYRHQKQMDLERTAALTTKGGTPPRRT